MELDSTAVEAIVSSALEEDGADRDLTTLALIPEDTVCEARIIVEQPGVLAGLPVALAVFQRLDRSLRATISHRDGTHLQDGPIAVAQLSGSARAILTGERAALNLLAHLSGIATLARRFADAVADTPATILDTRKTTPGLRFLEKYAVRCGGATNHRLGLQEAILVKDNHLRLAGGIQIAIARLAVGRVALPIEIEAETLEQVEEALAVGVQRILLDNMTVQQCRDAVQMTAGQAELEASGGITLENVRAYAQTGVDYISVGAITHSAASLPVSLDLLTR